MVFSFITMHRRFAGLPPAFLAFSTLPFLIVPSLNCSLVLSDLIVFNGFHFVSGRIVLQQLMRPLD